MTFDTRAGIRYAAAYLGKLALLALALVAIAVYLLMSLYSALPDDVTGGEVAGIGMEALVRGAMFLPLLVPAFLAGGSPEGSAGRLVWRMVLNACLVCVAFLAVGGLSYEITDVAVDRSKGIVMDVLALSLDARAVSALLMVIPACSVIDAILEYRSGRKEAV